MIKGSIYMKKFIVFIIALVVIGLMGQIIDKLLETPCYIIDLKSLIPL